MFVWFVFTWDKISGDTLAFSRKLQWNNQNLHLSELHLTPLHPPLWDSLCRAANKQHKSIRRHYKANSLQSDIPTFSGLWKAEQFTSLLEVSRNNVNQVSLRDFIWFQLLKSKDLLLFLSHLCKSNVFQSTLRWSVSDTATGRLFVHKLH